MVVLSTFLYYFFSRFTFEEIASYKFIQLNREYLISLRENNLIFISLIFIFLTIIWVFLLGFGSPIALLGGFIFGKWIGFFLAIVGLTIGATLLYIFSKYFFLDFIKKEFSARFKSLNFKFKKNEFFFFLIFRFIGGIPFFIANILPVLFNISLRNYFFGTFLGIFPQIFILVSLGTGLENIVEKNILMPSLTQIVMSPEIYQPILAFIFLLIILYLLRNFFFKK